MKKKKMPSIPNELLLQIFLKLPVKSLLRFRCVSKLWLSLISDPQFAASHVELALAGTHRIMLLRSSSPQTLSIDFDASLHDDSASLSIQFPSPFAGSEIIDSCRGFILLENCSNFYMWNPSVGIHTQIPLPSIASSPDFDPYPYLYGFGYDPSTDDYLVAIASYDPNAFDRGTQFEIFSLRASSWKKIECTRLPYMNSCIGHRVGTLLNGAIHWLAFRHDDAVSMDVIFVFDLVERNFSEIPLPENLFYDFEDPCGLLVHEDMLSLWIYGIDGTEIWVMKEYKVQSSWTKSIVVLYHDIPTQYFSPICSTECGIIGMDERSAGLVKCNTKGEVIEHRSYSSYDKGEEEEEGEEEKGGNTIITGATMYVHSLLSLPYVNWQAQDG